MVQVYLGRKGLCCQDKVVRKHVGNDHSRAPNRPLIAHRHRESNQRRPVADHRRRGGDGHIQIRPIDRGHQRGGVVVGQQIHHPRPGRDGGIVGGAANVHRRCLHQDGGGVAGGQRSHRPRQGTAMHRVALRGAAVRWKGGAHVHLGGKNIRHAGPRYRARPGIAHGQVVIQQRPNLRQVGGNDQLRGDGHIGQAFEHHRGLHDVEGVGRPIRVGPLAAGIIRPDRPKGAAVIRQAGIIPEIQVAGQRCFVAVGRIAGQVAIGLKTHPAIQADRAVEHRVIVGQTVHGPVMLVTITVLVMELVLMLVVMLLSALVMRLVVITLVTG